MGTLFSCLSRSRFCLRPRPKLNPPHSNTAISHPYPLAARQRALSEYRPCTPDGLRSSPRIGQSPTRPRSTSANTSRCTTPTQPSPHARAHTSTPRGPKRVHEIPFPLLLSSSPASASPRILSPASSMRPLALLRQAEVAGSSVGGGMAESRKKLRKVQLVDGGWELWREEDWDGYDLSDAGLLGAVGPSGNRWAGEDSVGYADGEMMPLHTGSPRAGDGRVNWEDEVRRVEMGIRDLSEDTVGMDEEPELGSIRIGGSG